MPARCFDKKNLARAAVTASIALAAVSAGLGAPPAQAVATEAAGTQAAAAAQAETSDFTYKNVLGQAVITGYTGPGGKVEIPSTLGLLPVTGIADGAFERNHAITEVVIPEGVTSIGERAFNDCTSLTNVSWPSTLQVIGASAFYSCGSLTEVDLPAGLTSIGEYAFFGCPSLTRVCIPGTVRNWGTASFAFNYELDKVTIGAGVTSVPERAFKDCKNLETVELPATLTTARRRAFENCNKLDTCDLSHLETIEYRAFACGNGTLPKLDLACAKVIEAEAFSYQQQATSITMPQVERIGDKAFFGVFAVNAESSVTLDLPASLVELGEGAFAQTASSLKAVNVDPGCAAYMSIDGVIYTKDGSTLVCVPAGYAPASRSFSTPSVTTRIAAWAFCGVTGLDAIEVGDPVTQLGEGAFNRCMARSVTLPAGITELPAEAFRLSGIESLDVPASVKTIGESALSSCGSLTSVTLHEGVETIAANAFGSDGELASLVLPSTLVSLDPTALASTDSMTSLTVAEGSAYSAAGGMIFTDGGTKLVIVLPAAVKDGCITVPDGVTTIASGSFGEVAGSCAVRVPNSVTTIEEKSLCYATGEGQECYNRLQPLYGTANNQALIDYANENYLVVFSQEKPALSVTQLTLAPGETASLSMTGVLSDVVFASSDNSVARVSSEGLVTAVAGGEADIFAVAGEHYFSAHVAVTGEAATKPYASYTRISTYDEADAWINANIEYNKPLAATSKELAGAYIYSSENYAGVNAFLEPLGFKAKADNDYGAGEYGEFEGISQNIASELAQYRLHENVVLYSGLEDAECIDGDGNSLVNILAMAGKEMTVKPILSTSLLQSVADSFRKQTTEKIMLEIYAPKDSTQGACLAAGALVSFEKEITFAPGTKFYVLDAGVRYMDTYGPNGDVAGKEPQRYMKLVPVTGEEPEPTPDPEPTPEPEPDPEPTPDDNRADDQAGDQTNDDAQQAAEKTSRVGGPTPATGDAATAVALPAAAGGTGLLAAAAALLRRLRHGR